MNQVLVLLEVRKIQHLVERHEISMPELKQLAQQHGLCTDVALSYIDKLVHEQQEMVAREIPWLVGFGIEVTDWTRIVHRTETIEVYDRWWHTACHVGRREIVNYVFTALDKANTERYYNSKMLRRRLLGAQLGRIPSLRAAYQCDWDTSWCLLDYTAYCIMREVRWHKKGPPSDAMLHDIHERWCRQFVRHPL